MHHQKLANSYKTMVTFIIKITIIFTRIVDYLLNLINYFAFKEQRMKERFLENIIIFTYSTRKETCLIYLYIHDNFHIQSSINARTNLLKKFSTRNFSAK